MALSKSYKPRSFLWFVTLGTLASILLTACGGSSERAVDSRLATATSVARIATPTEPRPPTATATVVAENSATASLEPTPTPSPQPAAATPTSEPEEPEGPSPGVEELQTTLDSLLADIDGTVAVSLATLDGDFLYGMNEYETMEAASLYKLAVMVEIFRQRETGILSFDDTVVLLDSYYVEGPDSFDLGDVGHAVPVDTLLFAMIAESSNVASYALLDLAGTANINTTMVELGLPGMEIRWSPGYMRPPDDNPEAPETPSLDEDDPVDSEEFVEEDETGTDPDEFIEDPESDPESDDDSARAPTVLTEPVAHWMSVGGPTITGTIRADAAFNVVTAADVAQLLVLMLNGQVVSEQASSEMLDLLASQQVFGGLAMSLPDGTVAHKTGYLPDGVVNDAGVIFTDSGPFVAVVLTEDVREDIAFDITSRIAVLLYEFGS